jgi:CubicO group peptidase (beta-lactamase class C family)
METEKVPGLSIAIIRDAKLFWCRGFGVKDAASKQPVDNDTVFEVASVSKTVFAYVVMKLCEKGVLSLDTPLTRYVPWRFVEGDPRLDLITARHVLTHTSGFQNWRSDEEPLRIHFTPGERFSYSGEAVYYLQSVVTHLTGRVDPEHDGTFEAGLRVCATDFDPYMKANLLVPFGMASSGYVWCDTFEKHAARPHDEQGKPTRQFKRGPVDAARYGAAGGLHTTATDYAKFLIEILKPRPVDAFRLRKSSLREMLRPQVKILPPTDPAIARAVESVREMLRPQVRTNVSMSQALGWQLQHTEKGDFICHGGGNPGFSAFVVGSVPRKSGLVILTNADSGYKVIHSLTMGEILHRFLGGKIPYPIF